MRPWGNHNRYGLHIHFPRYRTGFADTKRSFGIDAPINTYDAPRTRLLDGNSPLAAYAPNYDALPLQALDEEDPATGLPAPLVWPRIATPDFNFVFSGNTWPKFLNRYYHPTADAHVEQVLDVNGTSVPFTLGTLIGDSTTACATPSETVVVPANGTAVLSGEGSSDPDTYGRITPTHHFWDLDGNTGCKRNCIAPTEVPAGGNAAVDSTDNKDQDQEPARSNFDQQDAAAVGVKFKCDANVAPFTPVTLTVWDDNHTYRLHDTRPGAAFVHPQTNRQKIYIYCMPTPIIEIPLRPELWFVEYGAYVKVKLTNPDGTPAPNRTVTGNSSTGTDVAPPPSSAGEALIKSVSPARSATVQVTTDREGSTYVLVTPRSPGSGEVTFTSPGFAPQRLQFNALLPNDPPGDGLQLSAPTSLTFNTPAVINATVVGQQGPVSLVTFFATSGNIRFDDNRQYADKTGTQAYTQSGGGTRVAFTPIAGGIAQIVAISGKTTKTLSIPITGGTPPANSLQLTALPGIVPLGGTSAITATVLSGSQPVAGAQVVFQVDQGDLTLAGAPPRATQFTITTDARGVATQRFTANAEGGIRMTVRVNGTSLSKLLLFGVEPAAR